MKIRELLLLEVEPRVPNGNQEHATRLKARLARINRLEADRMEPLPPHTYSNKADNPDIPLK